MLILFYRHILNNGVKEDFYSILSDQVPFYLTLNKNNNNYKLINISEE